MSSKTIKKPANLKVMPDAVKELSFLQKLKNDIKYLYSNCVFSLNIRNPFRGKRSRAFTNTKGHHNPCSYCWRAGCHNCLAFLMADFSNTLRSDPDLTKRFEKVYNDTHYAGNRPARREMDRNVKAKQKKLNKNIK